MLVRAPATRSAGDAQDGTAVRDLATAVERMEPRPAECTRRCRQGHQLGDDRQCAAEEAGDIAVVEARALLDRVGEIERDEPAGPRSAPTLAAAREETQRAHGSTSRWPGTI